MFEEIFSLIHDEAVECSAAGIESPKVTPYAFFNKDTAGMLSEPEKLIDELLIQ